MMTDKSKWNPKDPWVPFKQPGHWVEDFSKQPNPSGWLPKKWEVLPVFPTEMVTYPEYQTVWQQLPNFVAELRLESMSRGRSAATSVWVDDQTGKSYPISFVSLGDVINKCTIINGRTNAIEWKAAKKGANYFIEPA
jgi:hypothetical protein